ncbi:MAG: putative 4-mercaptohistidine N1-methyltransferase [Chthoniobacterales bacterium]
MTPELYESDRLVREYLLFHYGSAEEILPWRDGPREALGFAERCVSELLEAAALPTAARALDIGCAVGRSSFELARHCREVVGIDYSRAFIAAAEAVRTRDSLGYAYAIEGDSTAHASACRPSGADPSRVRFETGDALALRADLGAFDVVLAANLLCRLPDPRKFLARLPSLVRPGGQLLLTTPFTWLEQFTPRESWIGGGAGESSAEVLDTLLEPHFELRAERDLPFLIREHARKYQWSVARGTRWLRRA